MLRCARPLILIALGCLLVPVAALGEVSRVAETLWSSLMNKYEPSVSPPGGVRVEVALLLSGMQISTSTETIELSAWWRLFWRDDRLMWNATEWNVSSLAFRPNEIWAPDITMYEKSEESVYAQEIIVYADGRVFLSTPRKSKFACPLVLATFPFDTQKCRFTIGSWSHDRTRVDVLPVPVDPAAYFEQYDTLALPDRTPIEVRDLSNFHEFFLRSVRVAHRDLEYTCCEEPFATLRVELEFVRSTTDYVCSVILPLIIVTIVGFGTLFMPSPASGAKPALCVTTLLTTATVFLAANNLTPNSNQTTLIGRLYIACLCTNLCTVMWSIWTTSLILVQKDNSSSVQHFMDFFYHFDQEQSGRLNKTEVECALDAVGLAQAEQRTLLGHLFPVDADGNETLHITEAQWAVVAALAHRSDRRAVYHNQLVQKAVTGAIISDFKAHGSNVGKSKHELYRFANNPGEQTEQQQQQQQLTPQSQSLRPFPGGSFRQPRGAPHGSSFHGTRHGSQDELGGADSVEEATERGDADSHRQRMVSREGLGVREGRGRRRSSVQGVTAVEEAVMKAEHRRRMSVEDSTEQVGVDVWPSDESGRADASAALSVGPPRLAIAQSPPHPESQQQQQPPDPEDHGAGVAVDGLQRRRGRGAAAGGASSERGTELTRRSSAGASFLRDMGELVSKRLDVRMGCTGSAEAQFDAVLQKLGNQMDQFAGVNSHPTGVARRIAASGDSWGRMILPCTFLLYILIEFGNSGVFTSSSQYIPTAGGGFKQPVLFEMTDFRAEGQPRLFRSWFRTKDVRSDEFDANADWLVHAE